MLILSQHGFSTYQPEGLGSLMANAGFVDLATTTGDGGTGNGVFCCTSGLAGD